MINCKFAGDFFGRPDAVRCGAKEDKPALINSPGACLRGCQTRVPKGSNEPAPVVLTVSANPKLWPKWAEKLRESRQEGEAGVGDTAARIIATEGLTGFAVAYNVNFGPSCGCGAKEWNEATRSGWNYRYPYPT